MKTTLALALVVAVGACKGNEVSPAKEQAVAPGPEENAAAKPVAPTADKPADKRADRSANPPPAAPAAAELAAKLALKTPAICAGFTPGGKGAFFVTESHDAASAFLQVVAVGDAVDPKLSADFEWIDNDAASKARAEFAAKASAALGELTPCSQWQNKGERVTAQINGKDLTISTKGTKLKFAVKSGITVERDVEGGAEYAVVDSAYSSSDFNSVAVVVNATAEAMSAYQVYWITASELGK
jgi:hypothetical protein